MLYHNCAVFSLKNEDKYFFNQFSEHSCICGIADGHGGSGASKRLATREIRSSLLMD
jgi:serine/threonine protein phosphatase PrpC